MRRQGGIVLVFVVIALVALGAMAGLAIDVGHLVNVKSRLQSTVDAAALAGARVLNEGGSTAAAAAAAGQLFNKNAATFRELREAGDVAPIVEFSSTLYPFAPGTVPARYVRVRVPELAFGASFARVLGIMTLDAGARAVAGPQPLQPEVPNTQLCDVAPILICGNGDPAQGGGAEHNWGYPGGSVVGLKLDSNNSAAGPGNFQLLALGGPGGENVRENLAGGTLGCTSVGDSANLLTEPGNKAGPTAQGLNTRFGEYLGPTSGWSRDDYPPDIIAAQPGQPVQLKCDNRTNACSIVQGSGANAIPIRQASQLDFNYAEYGRRQRLGAAAGAWDFPDGSEKRRVITVPVGECTGEGGRQTVPMMGFACFFLLQKVDQSSAAIFGEFIENCSTSGMPGGAGGGGVAPGPSTPFRIVLYDDAGSRDS